jgi:hypothetical protein
MMVTKFAKIALLKKQKKKVLPAPGDLQTLTESLIGKLQDLDLSLDAITAATYRLVMIDTQDRLMLHNRRRPGDMEQMT